MKSDTLRIVPMTRSHIKQCSEIVAASDPWKRLREQLDFSEVISQRKRSFHRAYVCTGETGVAGFIIFRAEPVFARGGYIRAIGVRADMRRRGVGRNLLSFSEGLISRYSPNLYICVSSFNKKAQLFYNRSGYVRVGKLKDLIWPGVSEYIYWKRLVRNPIGRVTRETCSRNNNENGVI